MKGHWEDIPIRVPGEPDGLHLCRAFYRAGIKPSKDLRDIRNLYKADFIFKISDNTVVKNRLGTLETVFETASEFDRLRYHSNPAVRRLLDKAIVLAELSHNPELDL